ncbi:hypothetical protein AMS68_003614 [Peltaster fructicola]|uniref:Protein-lysine N-methyltransferase EFM6 n=1 Tax=Peltaster fructicola TaxID=286661 RepID=A0A6H0XTK1_9PEZI|nr:hypothetical protein AMS68_003614 [Peltaster fructicola]
MYDLMVRNIELNDLTDRVKASIYDWGQPTPAAVPAHPDVILAADCVYFEPAFEPLRHTLIDLIGDSTKCYFCFKKRRRADLHFIKAAKKTFDVVEITDDPDYQTYARENVHLCV